MKIGLSTTIKYYVSLLKQTGSTILREQKRQQRELLIFVLLNIKEMLAYFHFLFSFIVPLSSSNDPSENFFFMVIIDTNIAKYRDMHFPYNETNFHLGQCLFLLVI